MNFFDTKPQFELIKNNLDLRLKEIHRHGKYILGPEVYELEKKLSDYLGVKYAITCANGTDALTLSLMSLDITAADAVIIPSFSFVSTVEAVALLGAQPIFVDVDKHTFNIDIESIEEAIKYVLNKTNLNLKAIIAVDLFGQTADYDQLNDIKDKYKINLLADSAQSFGAEWNKKKIGNLADITSTSFFPTKPLGCYGDGGAIFLNNEELYLKIKSLRSHGTSKTKYMYENIGINSRLDSIQAAILIEKLKIFDDELLLRDEIAKNYSENFQDILGIPKIHKNAKTVWAQYTLRSQDRENYIRILNEKGIPTIIYYPIPLHLQKPYKDAIISPTGLENSKQLSAEVFSLPLYPYLSKEHQNHINLSIKNL
tara:strand:+ start:164 stop:1273 length:1110 start_codon:yes stop_codon:yes gene_type:complete